MKNIKIIDTKLKFKELTERYITEKLIFHHTGNEYDDDMSAAQIDAIHKRQGWAGIGYHFVIRKNGDIERGRPARTVGAHCIGRNYDSIGIHLSGNFQKAKPTDRQTESAAMLVAKLCTDYDLPVTDKTIYGHCDFDNTACPGFYLYNLIPAIIKKAIYYSTEIEPESEIDDIDKIAVLSRRYESNGDPACVSSGAGDVGGVSYGLYQLASKVGSVDDFVDWLCYYPDDKLANYGRTLAQYHVNNPLFISAWRDIGTVDPKNFSKLQDEFIKTRFYDVAVSKLNAAMFNVNKHSEAMKAVIFARAVQNGASGCAELFKIAVARLGYDNLSYVDDEYFDREIINAVYEFLIDECDSAQKVGNIWISPNNFCRGSAQVIAGLRQRFVSERYDSLNILG